ncbi:uracil-DNA glycosylase family protein [Alphaproteobacteria bacterium GH1-50]|uniref:Uracil-DNA glycosylase family protein n=1 Tax=Kangsaoukella pontilimi TaxID=2691042 RepID=A0A7C9MSR2_9RHOB|nr:uracil-DNA glycosylase family protein [Kangsaoukella pontilimi]MXQ09537.1 uracil-DNA glycosylase family protein [Kangsaoukella pontilimi]
MEDLKAELTACTICRARFAATHTAHRPNPVVWFNGSARILIASQAPGLRVHRENKPFWDRSGTRLREWMGIDEATFYDRDRVAIVPMAFCFPGYNASGSDLPPPPVCAATWRDRIMERLEGIRLTLLIGGYAQKWHLGADARAGVTRTVMDWRSVGPDVMPLPHPSWRNTAWLGKNPWFEAELLPTLRLRVKEALT